jgi:hypothetical protein
MYRFRILLRMCWCGLNISVPKPTTLKQETPLLEPLRSADACGPRREGFRSRLNPKEHLNLSLEVRRPTLGSLEPTTSYISLARLRA